MQVIRDVVQRSYYLCRLCHLLNEVENVLRNLTEGKQTTYCSISSTCSDYVSYIVCCVVLCVYHCRICCKKYKSWKCVVRNLHVN